MRPNRFGLVAAVMVAITTGLMAFSAAAAPTRAPALPPIPPAALVKGMAAAPALITRLNLPCELAAARLIGEGKQPNAVAGQPPVKTAYYEIACTGAFGYIVTAPEAGEASAFTCLEAANPLPNGSPNPAMCRLPANADQRPGLVPLVAKGGAPCTPTGGRVIGQTPTQTILEVACSEGMGYIMMASRPPRATEPVQMTTCLAFQAAGNVNCTLTDIASQTALIDTYAARSDHPCAVKDRRYVMTTRQGSSYYEIACNDGKGYIIEMSTPGAIVRTIDCAVADFVAGGCTLTNARAAQTAQAGLYTQLANRSGFNCTVERYAPLPAPRGKDIVELKCSNRPDGAIGIFPGPGQGDPQIIDCARAIIAGFRCTFSQPADSYPRLTEDLKRLGKNDCVVGNSRAVGVNQEQTIFYMEVACADGLPGYIIEYQREPTILATKVSVCTQMRAGSCTLPGNTGRAGAPAAAAPPAGAAPATPRPAR